MVFFLRNISCCHCIEKHLLQVQDRQDLGPRVQTTVLPASDADAGNEMLKALGFII